MKRIHLVGRKNSGKTTLVTELLAEFARLGVRVGTIKHTHHQHELDTPGKDSHRHRTAGAAVVGILSRSLNAVYWPSDAPQAGPDEDRYTSFAPHFSACELVLVEGDSQTTACKIEVWRNAINSPPIAEADPAIRAMITDDAHSLDIPTWPRSDIGTLAQNLLAIVSSE